MTVDKIDHIGIAVEKIDDMLPYYRDGLGLEYRGSEVVAEQKVRVAFLQVGESRIELLEPISRDSPIAKFLSKRGSGIHHIAIKVDDIEQALRCHEENGAVLIDKKPRIGAHDMRIAFVHPTSTGGVLIELCEEPQDSAH
ncbi:MAG: methylmalonyl-CoA epimerase [Candidatus Thorarchaeota archaeon]|nr:methylmalonyl-CoA epimerase [Candidatus Thorarchaeota archaeon]